jgi:hypothetical protein
MWTDPAKMTKNKEQEEQTKTYLKQKIVFSPYLAALFPQ